MRQAQTLGIEHDPMQVFNKFVDPEQFRAVVPKRLKISRRSQPWFSYRGRVLNVSLQSLLPPTDVHAMEGVKRDHTGTHYPVQEVGDGVYVRFHHFL
ncbi:MAG: hypothetical protein OXR66_00660 [Candidatus Woesearchaeota archaeon]|nr:hypothetical protein [Candidatus Woesearchaeota archaeon]